MAIQIQVTDATTQQVLAGMDTLKAECASAQSIINGIMGSMVWQAPSAQVYASNLSEWQQGVNEIKNGVESLRDRLQLHQQNTTTTEHTATGQAKWYVQS